MSCPTTVPCPRCGRPAVYAATNDFRPFCSEKCRLLDLGAWLSEDYRIALKAGEDTDEGPESSQ